MNAYAVLGLDRTATMDEIHAAYRARARKYHPDAGGDAWAFKQLQAAYEELLQGDSANDHEDGPAEYQPDADQFTPDVFEASASPAAIRLAAAIFGAAVGLAVSWWLDANPFLGAIFGGIPGLLAGGAFADGSR